MQIDCKEVAFVRGICAICNIYFNSYILGLIFGCSFMSYVTFCKGESSVHCYDFICSYVRFILFSNIDSKCLVSRNAGNFYDLPPEYEQKALYCQLFCLEVLFVGFSVIYDFCFLKWSVLICYTDSSLLCFGW